MPSEPMVFVVDIDAATRNAVRELASSMNLACQCYATGKEFFGEYTDSRPGCLVLEVSIPDMSGLEIQRRLAANHAALPLIFLTSHAEVSLGVELMRAGAFHYLQKPIRPLELWNTIQKAIAVDKLRWQAQQRHQRVLDGLVRLSGKERELLRLIAQGRSSTAMAEELNVSVRTIEQYRPSLMRKLNLRSSVGLIHFALLAFRNGSSPGNGSQTSRLRGRLACRLLVDSLEQGAETSYR